MQGKLLFSILILGAFSATNSSSFTGISVTFRESRRRHEMYIGHAHLSVCLCVCPSPHSHITARTKM